MSHHPYWSNIILGLFEEQILIERILLHLFLDVSIDFLAPKVWLWILEFEIVVEL